MTNWFSRMQGSGAELKGGAEVHRWSSGLAWALGSAVTVEVKMGRPEVKF